MKREDENQVVSIGSSFGEHLDQMLLDPEFAAEYLMGAVEDADYDADYLKVALNRIARLWGVRDLSKVTGITREAIYKMLKPEGNPSLSNFEKILNAMGLRLVVVPINRDIASEQSETGSVKRKHDQPRIAAPSYPTEKGTSSRSWGSKVASGRKTTAAARSGRRTSKKR